MRYRDFDAYWAEQEKEPVKATIAGKEYELPSALPAKVMLQVIRMHKKGVDEVGFDAIIDLGRALFGEQLEEILDSGISMEQLGDVITWVCQSYGSGEQNDTGNPSEGSTS